MPDSPPDACGYHYATPAPGHHHAYLLPEVERILAGHTAQPGKLFDLGCGNGSVAAHFAALGYQVVGVDPSADGIRVGSAAFPHVDLYQGTAYDDLASEYGTFPTVISLEVVEHVYSPRDYAATLFNLVSPGGLAVVSTPYHGYLKNLALAVAGKWEAHLTPLWDHGHIKFWSIGTLDTLLREAGFGQIEFRRVGRISALAKSMIAIASRPA